MHRMTVLMICAATALACGGREVVPDYDWDRSPSALVASVAVKGGFVPQMMSFLQHDYGASFMRLMGDGTLYYGEPNQVLIRSLTPAEVGSLLRLVRPDLFSGYKEQYQAGMATDMPYTWVTVSTPEYGKKKVGVYGFSMAGRAGYGDTPTSLVDAIKALNAARSGGKAYTPKQIRIATQQADLKNYPTLDKAKIQKWPLSPMDPANALLTTTGEKGFMVTSAKDTAALLPLFKAAPMGLLRRSIMISHGAQHYELNHAAVLP